MITRYFVSRDADGSVSHLVRVFDSGTALWGEFFIDGQWQRHEAATDYLFDQSYHEEIDEDKAQKIAAALTSRRTQAGDNIARPAGASADQAARIREAFRQFFPGGGPQLPDPIPDHGQLSGSDWSIRYALNTDETGNPRLDFLAENRLTEPLFGQVSHDGTAVALDTFEQQYSYDPEVAGDKSAAEKRMHDHNLAVQQQLRTRRLA